MRTRRVVVAVGGLALLLMALSLPAGMVSAPVIAGGQSDCHGSLTSTIQALPPFSPKDVWINYSVNASNHHESVRWTELWYQGPGANGWALYMPPWNPSGRWVVSSDSSHGDHWDDDDHGSANGTIIFDTTFTGGDGHYNFTTVAVGRHHRREPGPPFQNATIKANTTVDSLPPVLFIITPTPDSWTNSARLAWVAQDAVSGVANVSVSLDGGRVQNFINATGTMEMNLTTQGLHDVVVTARDRAGNAITIPFSFHYDTQAPSLTVTSPAADAFLNATSVTIEWTLSDPAPITSVQLSVDGGPVVALSNTTSSYALTSLADASHTVSLLAQDAAGNFASQVLPFVVDTTPPTVQILTPAEGSFSNSSQVQVFWSGSDLGSGIDHYLVSMDGGTPVRLTNAAGYVFPGATEGRHMVTVVAFDRAGNSAKTEANVTVDTIAPAVVITAPSPGAALSGSVSVNFTATDSGSGIAKVVLLLDGSLVPVATGETSVALPASGLTPGPHAVTLEAWDRAGNSNLTAVAFSYGGGTPSGPGGSSLPATDFWVIMAIIGVIAVGSAYFAVRRRGKPKP